MRKGWGRRGWAGGRGGSSEVGRYWVVDGGVTKEGGWGR